MGSLVFRLEIDYQREMLRLQSKYICLDHCLTLVQGGEEKRKRPNSHAQEFKIYSTQPKGVLISVFHQLRSPTSVGEE